LTTKAKLLKAATKAFGSTAWVRENRDALAGPERLKAHERVLVIAARMREVDKLYTGKAMQDARHALAKAGRFAVEVDGGPPSLDQLRAAVEQSERLDALWVERSELKAQLDGSGLWRQRWDAGDILGPFAQIRASANSADELLVKIEARGPAGAAKARAS
jgi:hypothetical protein